MPGPTPLVRDVRPALERGREHLDHALARATKSEERAYVRVLLRAIGDPLPR